MARPVHQAVPLLIIFAVALAALIVARQLLVPKSFGDIGHYRADAVGEIASQEIVYAGYRACLDCHDEVYEQKRESNHAGVSCEVCHGPAIGHVEAPDEFTPSAPRDRGGCPLCHAYNPSRPSGFPQILPELHNPGKACMTCHDPHAPTLPHAPKECSACHREIASRKMVSHHATLDCTTCHEVPGDHWSNPRMIRPSKPTSRDLCGSCHYRGSDGPREAPRIDAEEHHQRYLCWSCHYPHDPEAGS